MTELKQVKPSLISLDLSDQDAMSESHVYRSRAVTYLVMLLTLQLFAELQAQVPAAALALQLSASLILPQVLVCSPPAERYLLAE